MYAIRSYYAKANSVMVPDPSTSRISAMRSRPRVNPIDSYLFGNRDDQPWEADFGGFGRTFPHPLGTLEDKYFTTLLTLSPYGDRLTSDFAKALISAEGLGEDEVTDFLGVSFSVTDYVGHFFGPSSLEAEDNLLQLDRTLADLFAFA